MTISPLDVRNQVFRRRFRGYDPDEVKTFLDAVADYMEEMLKEKEVLEKGNSMLQERVDSYVEIEATLRDTLVTAQRIGDEARSSAQKDADQLLKQAEMDAQKRLAEAGKRVQDLTGRRENLRAQTIAFVAQLRGLIEAQLNFINSIEHEVGYRQSPEDQGVKVCEDVGS